MADPNGTGRLRFVAAGREHAPLLMALDADPEVMRYLNGGRPTTLAESEARIAAGHLWLAAELPGDEVAGWFSLRRSGTAALELGYRLFPRAWGRGLATEGARALVDHGFSVLGAELVWAQTMTVNAASRRVLERCGLRHTATFFADWGEVIEGSEHGDVRYELTRAEWAAAGR
jgi:RimJ/RimL family protein N-acetyltransferase